MGEVVPGGAVLAVVLPDGAPLALAQVGTPFPPGDSPVPGVLQPVAFLADGLPRQSSSLYQHAKRADRTMVTRRTCCRRGGGGTVGSRVRSACASTYPLRA